MLTDLRYTGDLRSAVPSPLGRHVAVGGRAGRAVGDLVGRHAGWRVGGQQSS